ncbi:MAG: tripartite tricarboxylate transporter substrate binding protein [Acetobacteraceae bacterium]|nr:tripartite tricarboxylate transporter substrate binding protein [Acetobacteraceae bacterium]
MRRRTLLAASTAGLLGAPAALHAQGGAGPWPNRPVRIIVPYAPGGTSDIIVRPIAERLERAFGRPFIVDNRAGAGGTVGSAAAAGERPDGHTLVVANTGPLAVAPSLYPNLAYDPARAFAWIAMFGGAPIVCAVKGDGPVRGMDDYLAAAKARPEAVSFGSSGVGSAGHLTGVLFGMETGARMLHIPYRGAGEAQQAVLSGDTTSLWDTSGANAAAIRAGTLRGLAVSSAERVSALPAVPTLKELGWPGVVSTNWFLLAAPAGLDPAIAARLAEAVHAALAEPAIRERLEAAGVVSLGQMAPQAIAAFVAEETARWAPVVRASGAKPA